MTGLAVDPSGLTAVAGAYDGVAGALTQVLLSVRAHGHPDTGRGDTTAQVAAVADGCVRGLHVLAAAAGADAEALRSAAAEYERADATAMRAR